MITIKFNKVDEEKNEVHMVNTIKMNVPEIAWDVFERITIKDLDFYNAKGANEIEIFEQGGRDDFKVLE